MKKYKSIVDHIWNCGCGSMNSPYRTVCGFCGAENKNSDNQEIEKNNKKFTNTINKIKHIGII